jgi:hypothetical protein
LFVFLFLLFCRPTGKIFKVIADNIKHGVNPVVGDIVTFSYQYFTKHMIPIKPAIECIRRDVAWEKVVADFEESAANVPTLLNSV